MQHRAEAPGKQVQVALTSKTLRWLSRAPSQAGKVQTRRRPNRQRKRRQELLKRKKKLGKAVEVGQKNSAVGTSRAAKEGGRHFSPLFSGHYIYLCN